MKFSEEFRGVHSRMNSICKGVESCKSLAGSKNWENFIVTTLQLGWRREWGEGEGWQEMVPGAGGQTVVVVEGLACVISEDV